jgi:hypothetical protein
MNSILNPLLAVLAIVVPLGLAHVILLWQERNPACDCREEFSITRDDLRQAGMELSHAEEKFGAL